MQDEYVQLMYFYRSIFKEIFEETMSLMGQRDIFAILQLSARKFAENQLSKSKIAQSNLINAIETLMELNRPEIFEEGTIILKRCPFRTRSSDEILENLM